MTSYGSGPVLTPYRDALNAAGSDPFQYRGSGDLAHGDHPAIIPDCAAHVGRPCGDPARIHHRSGRFTGLQGSRDRHPARWCALAGEGAHSFDQGLRSDPRSSPLVQASRPAKESPTIGTVSEAPNMLRRHFLMATGRRSCDSHRSRRIRPGASAAQAERPLHGRFLAASVGLPLAAGATGEHEGRGGQLGHHLFTPTPPARRTSRSRT